MTVTSLVLFLTVQVGGGSPQKAPRETLAWKTERRSPMSPVLYSSLTLSLLSVPKCGTSLCLVSSVLPVLEGADAWRGGGGRLAGITRRHP